jgi:hypothetical protein
MKFLIQTIIVLTVLNLAMGNLALAQNTRDQRIAESPTEPTVLEPTSQEPTDRRLRPAPAPPESAFPMLTTPAPLPEAPVPPEQPAPSPYPTRTKSTGHISSRKILVIPATDIEAEDLVEITQDLLVMSHILDERFKGSRTIKGVFTDFGDFFGRDNRSTEAIYMQGYGALFLMEVNFAFSPRFTSQEQKDEETAEQVDPTWQRAREQIFSPKAPMPGMPGFSGQGPGLVKFDQLKKEIIETLKHAANIRNLAPDEWIIVTVIGQGWQPGEFYEDYYRSATSRSRTSRDRRSSRSSRGEAEAGAYGGGMVGGMGGGMMGGMMGGMGSYGGGMGGYGGGMGGYGGGMGGFGGMAVYGEMSLPSATVLTIRAKKSDVGDFARDDLDFEEFQELVEIFTY